MLSNGVFDYWYCYFFHGAIELLKLQIDRNFFSSKFKKQSLDKTVSDDHKMIQKVKNHFSQIKMQTICLHLA